MSQISGKKEITVTMADNGGVLIVVNRPVEQTVSAGRESLTSFKTTRTETSLFTAGSVDDAMVIIRDKMLELQS